MTDPEILQINLFEAVVGEAEPSQPAASVECTECGASFDAPGGMGRPRRFCSDDCRHRHKVDQKRAWSHRSPPAEPTHCAGCGVPLAVRDVSSGRFKRFCKPECRVRLRRRESRRPDLTDLQQTDLWKGILNEK